jgi:hypothetical protein
MKHDSWHMPIGRCAAVAVHPIAMAPFVGGPRVRALVIETQALVVGGVHMASPSRGKHHLNAHDNEDRRHGYQARHGRVAMVPKVGQAWIGERLEGGGQQVNEGCRDENAGTEVS